MNDTVRKAHYLQNLSALVKVNERDLEAVIKKNKGYINNVKPVVPVRIQPVFSQPLEEYCLALLLQFPKLSSYKNKLKAEYFENSENREVFISLCQNDDIDLIKSNLDYSIREHLDKLQKKDVPSDKIEEKMAVCTLRLHEKYLRSLEIKRETIFAAEAASKGSIAGLSKLEEQGIEGSAQLREVFSKKSKGGLHGGESDERRKYTQR
jgi:hypothetical protein